MKKGKHEYRFKLEPFSLVATHFIDGKLEEERTFNLKETTREKLLKERMSDASTIVVKRGKTLLSAKIPKRLSLSDKEFSQSLCNNCKNCRPILCKKVLDRIYSVHKQEDIPENLRLESLKESKLIEKYPFITSGFETFNQSETFNYFCIKECENYEAIK